VARTHHRRHDDGTPDPMLQHKNPRRPPLGHCVASSLPPEALGATTLDDSIVV
jgi:hypothetical protein